MKLRDLSAQFIGHVQERAYHRLQQSVDGAQGILFQCPKCADGKPIVEDETGRGRAGAHYVICLFANPVNAPLPPDVAGSARWIRSGDTIETLTLTPSVNLAFAPGPADADVELPAPCQWHGWVKNGDAA